MEITVENVKCGGCASTIKKTLLALSGVQQVQIDVQSGVITLDGGVDEIEVKSELSRLGYPETGSVEGLEKVAKQARSMVSCAIGKVSK